MTKKAKLLLLKDALVIEYLEPFPQSIHQNILDSWYELGEQLKDILDVATLDFHHLGALVNIIRDKRNEDHQLRGHAVKLKNDYRGTKELEQFIEGYKNAELVPSMITIDYKPLYKKGDKMKPLDKETFNSQSSKVLKIKGKQLIKFLLSQIADENLDGTLKVYSSFIDQPPVNIKDYPNKKMEFDARHNKNAVKILWQFFKDQKLPVRDAKLATMKILVYMTCIKSYRDYIKELGFKNKTYRSEEEYYISRFIDLSKDR